LASATSTYDAFLSSLPARPNSVNPRSPLSFLSRSLYVLTPLSGSFHTNTNYIDRSPCQPLPDNRPGQDPAHLIFPNRYCLIQLYMPVSHILAPYKPLLKLFAIKAVVFLTFWQSTLLGALSFIGVVKDQKYMYVTLWQLILENLRHSYCIVRLGLPRKSTLELRRCFKPLR
jgi:uncharacterized protein Usg